MDPLPSAPTASFLPSSARLYLRLATLDNTCGTCAREYRQWLVANEDEESPEVLALTSRVLSHERQQPITPGMLTARAADLASLLQLSHAEQLRVVARSRRKFRSPALAAALLRFARTLWQTDPAKARDLAEVAAVIARFAGGAPLQALAAAYRANAERALGALKAAEGTMKEARQLASLDRLPPLLAAELGCLDGSLLKDQRKLPDARAVLTRSNLIFIMSADLVGRIRCEAKLAEIERMECQYQEAIDRLLGALALVTPRTPPDVFLTTLQSLTACFTEAGRHQEARQLMAAIRPLHSVCGDHQRIRLLWLEGEVARALDDTAEAEAVFREGVSVAVNSGHLLIAAFMALELALLLFAEDRRRELRAVSGMLPPIFRAEGLEKEAASALYLLHQAAAEDRVTAEILDNVREALNRSQWQHQVPRSR